ncbi:LOW QUALITY PROTEIN: uncharacterized protein FYW61_012113, partial [Anableps anableps]
LKEKLEWQMRIEELEGERNFLQSQLSSLASQPKDEPFKDPFSLNASENSDLSSTSHIIYIVLSSSSSYPKKQKQKFKNKHSKAKKYKNEHKNFQQRGEPKILVQKIVHKQKL